MPKFLSDGHFSGASTDLTIDGLLNVGSNSVGNGSRVLIYGEDEQVGFEQYIAGGGQTTVPQFKLGRSASEYLGIYVEDRNAHIIHRQDETSGTMSMRFEMWDSGSGAHEWHWLSSDESGATQSTPMKLTKGGTLELMAGGQVKAPAFYDSDNTSYYLNPASASNIATLTSTGITISNNNPKIVFTDSSGSTYEWWTRYKDNVYEFLWGGGVKYWFKNNHELRFGDRDSGLLTNQAIRDPFIRKAGNTTINSINIGHLQLGTNNTTQVTIGATGDTTFAGNVYSTAFYDSDNTAYFMDPGNTGTSAAFAGSIETQNIKVAEKIIHKGDANTSINFTSDNIDFETNNIIALTLDSSQDATFTGHAKLASSKYLEYLGSGKLINMDIAGWTAGQQEHNILYAGWTSSTGDYLSLKVPGNSTVDHGNLIIGDTGLWYGRMDATDSAAATDSNTNPNGDSNYFRVNTAGDLQVSGSITSPIFYDTAGTTYYLDLGNTSNSLTIPGIISMVSNKGVTWPGGSIRAEGNILKLVATDLIQLQDATQIYYNGGDAAIGLDIHNSGTATGDDAKINFETQGQYDYVLGIDRSASEFKISRSGAFGTNDVIRLDSSSNATFAGNITTSGNIILSGAANEIIKSNGSIRLNIDSDANQSDRIFIVSTGANSELFRVDESGNGTFAGNITSQAIKVDQTGSDAGLHIGRSDMTSSNFATTNNAIFFGDELPAGSYRHQASISAVREAWSNSPTSLVFKTSATVNSATTALTLDSSQKATFTGRVDLQRDLRIRGNDSNPSLGVVRLLSDSNNQLIIDTGNDGANQTIIDGSGNVTFAGSIYMPNYIYHSGDTNTYFGFGGTDYFNVVTGGSNAIIAHDNGAVYLYHSGSQRVQTTSEGVSVYGSQLLQGTASTSVSTPKTELGGFITIPGPETSRYTYLTGVSENKLGGLYRKGSGAGYSLVSTKDGSTITSNWLENAFQANDNFSSLNSTAAQTNLVITITVPTMHHGSNAGIAFSNSSWIAKNVKIEVYDGTSWSTIYDVSSSTRTTHMNYFSKGSTGVTQLRYTLTNFATTSCRILSIFANNYSGGDGVNSQLYADNTLYGNQIIQSGYSMYAPIYYETGSTTNYLDLGNTGTSLQTAGTIKASSVASMYTSSDRGYFTAGTNDASNQHLYLGSFAGATLKELTFSASNSGFYPQLDNAIDLGLSSKKWKNVYATAFYGDGSNLTNLPSGNTTTINNNANNKVITGSDTADTLEAESGLTYTNTDSGGLTIGGGSVNAMLQLHTKDGSMSTRNADILFHVDGSDVSRLRFNNNVSGIATNTLTYNVGTNPKFYLYADGNAQTVGYMTSTMFRDADNTTYYLDPSSTTTSLNVAGKIVGFGDFTGANTALNSRTGSGVAIGQYNSSYGYIDIASTNSAFGSWIDFSKGNGTDYAGRIRYHNSNETFTFTVNGTDQFYIYSTYSRSATSSRAPLFYDSDNTSYYLNPAGTSVINDIEIDDYIYHKGDTHTSIYFESDRQVYQAGGTTMLQMNKNYYGGQYTGLETGIGLHSENLGGANLIKKGTDIAVSGVREEVTGPDGSRKVQAHASTGNGNSSNCYQWYSSENVVINPEKDYEFSVWIKSTGDDHLYLGWHEYNSSGTKISSNPYFHTSKIDTSSVRNVNGWVLLKYQLKSHRTTSGQADSEGTDRYASNGTSSNFQPSGSTGVMHSTTKLIHLRLGTCYGSVNGSKSYFYNPKIIEAQNEEFQWNTSAARVFATEKVQSPLFSDNNNTTYYIDPSSTGTSINLNGGGTFQGAVTIDSDGATDNYYLNFNEAGSSRFTIYENGNNVYFNGWAGHTIFRPAMAGSGSFAVTQGNTQFDTSGNARFAGKVKVQGDPPITPNTNFDDLVITDSAHAGISIFSGGTDKHGAIYFGDAGANNRGQIKYLHDTDAMTFATAAGSPSLTLDSLLNVTVAGDLTISGGDITLSGTGRIQGVDTVSAGTDAANKTYVDNAVSGLATADTTYDFNMSTQLTANTWTDSGISSSNMATGTYIMQAEVSDYTLGGGHYTEYYSATMSWYASGTNSDYHDEIIIHRAGHAPNNGDVQFRTLRNLSGVLKLQIKHNMSYNAAPDQSSGKTFKFKFRKMI